MVQRTREHPAGAALARQRAVSMEDPLLRLAATMGNHAFGVLARQVAAAVPSARARGVLSGAAGAHTAERPAAAGQGRIDAVLARDPAHEDAGSSAEAVELRTDALDAHPDPDRTGLDLPEPRAARAPGLSRRSIQRKVGFEFETGDWYAWKYVGSKAPPSRNEPNNFLPAMLRPAKRQVEPLHYGTGFELQADDSPGPTKSSLEFVTKPPLATESATSVDDLHRLFHLIGVIVDRLDKYKGRVAGRAGPARDNYVFPEEHSLNQAGFYISDSAAGGSTRFKMQATAGIRLKDLPDVMQYFSPRVPGELPGSQEASHRAPSREFMMHEQRNIISLGSAKGWATSAGNRIEAAYLHGQAQGAANPFQTRRADLVGFLAAVMVFVYNIAQFSSELLKYDHQLFGRNDFAVMFTGIDPAQQAVFGQAPRLLIDGVIDELNASAGLPTALTHASPVAFNAMLKVRNPEDEVMRGRPEFSRVPVLRDVTLYNWLGVIAKGGPDVMTPTHIEGYLRHMAGKRGEQTDDEAFQKKTTQHKEYLESVGPYQKDRSSGGDDLFLFENRAIVNAWEQGLTEVSLAQAAPLAEAYLKFFMKIERRQFGQFPQYK